MTKLYITEHVDPRYLSGSPVPVVRMPPLASQTVTIGGASVQSNAFGSETKIICVHTDAVCSIEVGLNPVANSNSRRLAANATEYFDVSNGHKIAVITNS